MGWFSRKSDRWERQPGDIATRIESQNVKRDFINRPFVVYDGTVALVFTEGRLVGHLASGKHDIDGPFRKWLAGDTPTTLVIVDDGDITVDFDITGLYSRENIQADAAVRVVFSLDRPEEFYRNVMKDRKQYAEEDLRTLLRSELFDALLAFTSTHPIDDLYGNPALRSQAEQQLRDRVGASLSRVGFSLVAVNVLRITSDQFDAHRGKQADVHMEGRDTDVEAARLEVMKKARENLADAVRHRAVTKTELQDAINQAVHELGLKDRLREDELAQLNARLEQDALDYEQQRTQSREMGAVEHELDVDSTKRDHERDQSGLDVDTFLAQQIKQAEAGEQLRDFERSGDEKDWELARKMRDDALEARKRKKMTDVEIERERIESLSKADTSTKIALGLGDAETLLELERLEKQENMSPEQLLVLAAEKSEAAAAALAERFKAEGKMNDDLMEQLKRQLDMERQTNREHAGQLERVLNQALDKMGDVASARAKAGGPGDQTIVTGGMGGPTVVNPNQPKKPKDDGDDAKE
ncbi:MAG: SPFH domain-containing protein [Phycisphaerales bacterium]|nr:MAG: SPFH domain-containing protein [Phycisphaerales bacterium]